MWRPRQNVKNRRLCHITTGQNVVLHGYAGTGKTFVSLYMALKDIQDQIDDLTKVVIIRSAVPTRDMGFLPGKKEDKSNAYELPYQIICTKLFNNGTAYDQLKRHGVIEFQTTSYIRGTTFENCIVIIDEVQNMNWHEISSIITRLGDNCRLIICGDFRQSDFHKRSDREGIHKFMKVLKKMKTFDLIEFQIDDIVRNDIVKEFIIAVDEVESHG